MKKIILTAFGAIFMVSCAGYKLYQREEVNTDGLYRDSEQSADTSSFGNVHWRELFTDPHLQALVEQGLQSNTDLRIAHLKVDQAQASLQASRLAYLPSVGIDANGATGSSSQNFAINATANWEIDIFGKLTAAKRGAKSALEQSQEYRLAVQTQLISTIAQSYYTLLMLDAQCDISRRTAENWRKNVDVLRALKAAGAVSEAAVAQSDANRLSVEASVLTLTQQIKATENSLSTLLGMAPQAIARGVLDGQQFPKNLSVGVPLMMLSNRPDVRQAQAAVAQAFYATQQAKASFYPSITLSGSGGWSGAAGAITNPAALIGQLIGSLTQPIFNRGKNIAQLKIAKSEQEQASLKFQQCLLDAGAEVNDALTEWQTASSRIEIDKQQIEQLKVATYSTQMMMTHGSTTYLEVLTAEQSLLQAELTNINDRYDEIGGIVKLYHALGGGR